MNAEESEDNMMPTHYKSSEFDNGYTVREKDRQNRKERRKMVKKRRGKKRRKRK